MKIIDEFCKLLNINPPPEGKILLLERLFVVTIMDDLENHIAQLEIGVVKSFSRDDPIFKSTTRALFLEELLNKPVVGLSNHIIFEVVLRKDVIELRRKEYRP